MFCYRSLSLTPSIYLGIFIYSTCRIKCNLWQFGDEGQLETKTEQLANFIITFISSAVSRYSFSLSLSITLLFSVSLCSSFTWSLAQLIQFVTQATHFAFFGRICNICNNQCCTAQWEKCHLHRVNFFELEKMYWLITLLTQINIFLSCSTRLLSTIDRKQILVASLVVCAC